MLDPVPRPVWGRSVVPPVEIEQALWAFESGRLPLMNGHVTLQVRLFGR